MRSGYVGKDEPVALDDLADRDGDGPVEHRPIPRERMKFASLSALVHPWRQIVEERAIELAPGKRAIELFRVDARQHGTKAVLDHAIGQLIRRNPPDRKERCQPASRELLLPVLTNVLE